MSVAIFQQDETSRISYPGHDEYTIKFLIAVPTKLRDWEASYEIGKAIEEAADGLLLSRTTEVVDHRPTPDEYHVRVTATFTREF